MKVLYVEDDARDADLARRAFARLSTHFRLELASGLDEARERLGEGTAHDLVLTDLKLPDGSGLQLLAEIRARALPVAAVVLTGSESDDTAVAAFKAGADDLVLKTDGYLARLPGVLAAALGRFRAGAARQEPPLRVLYAEDSAIDADLTRRHLARHAPNIRLEVVPGVPELLQRLPRVAGEAPPCDVLLLDYRLAGTDALEALRMLREERHLHLPVVLVTGQGDGEVAARAFRCGAANYVIKRPGYLSELPAVLESAYDRAQRVRNIAEHRLIEVGLRQSEQHYRELVSAVPGAVYSFRVDAQGRRSFPFMSEGIGNLAGLSPVEVMADAAVAFQRIPAEAMPAVEQSIGTSREQLSPWIHEFPIRTSGGEDKWLRGQSLPHREADGAVVWHGVFTDITERKRADRLLRQITEGTASTTGGEFLRTLTRILAEALGVRYAFVGELVGPGRDRARVISMWNGLEHAEPFEYPLAGTPCQIAFEETECFYPSGVQDLFPRDEDLVMLGVDSYVGIRLQSSKGAPLGLLTIMHTRKLPHEAHARSVMRIFAARAGAELERLRASEALERSERRFGKAFRSSPLGVVLSRLADGKVLDMNDAACELLGYTRQEVVGRTTFDLGIWLDASERARAVEMLRNAGSVQGLEHLIRRKSGESRMVKDWLELIELEGEPCIVGSILDVSEARHASEALRDSETRFRDLTELSSDWYWELDDRFRFSLVSGGIEQHLNMDVEVLIGKTRWELDYLGVSDADWARHRAALEAHQPFRDFRVARRNRAGEIKYQSLSGQPRFDSAGRFLGYRGVGHDITAETLAELALRASEERFRRLVDAAPIAVLLHQDLRIVFANRTAADLYGVPTAGQLIGRPITELFPPELRDTVRQRSADAIATGRQLPMMEERALRPDGSLVDIEATAIPIEHDGRPAVLTVHRDITERKRAEKKLRKRDAHLHLLTENIPAAVAYADRDFVIQVANQRYVELNCGSGVEVVGRHVRDVVGEKAWPEVAKHGARVLAGEPVVYERTHERPDGERREIEVHLDPDRAAGGEVRGYYEFILDISERKRAQAALSESEARFRDLSELSSDWYWEQDADLRFVDMQDAPTGSSPLRAGGYTGKTRWEAYAECLAPEQWAAHRRQVEARETFHDLELARPSQDGQMRWISISGLPIFDKDGRFKGYRGIGKDITERKTTENVLRLLSTGMTRLSGEALFNEVAGRMAEYLKVEIGFVSRLQGPANARIRTLGLCIDRQVMPALEFELAGTPCETVIGKQPAILPERVRQMYPAFRIAADLGISGYAAVPLFDSLGKPIGAVGVMSRAPLQESAARIEALLQLFAVRVATEIERQSADARFRDLFEFSADACLIVNQEGIITAMNQGARSLLGYSSGELTGLPVDALVPEHARRGHAGLRRKFHADSTSRSMGSGRAELYACHKDGTMIPVDIDLHPLQTDDGAVVVATVRDMTERKRMEKERALLEAQLRQSQKMEAVGTLAGGIAHDFNNIIGTILGNAAFARADVGSDHRALESIIEIDKAGRRARDLVQQILAFSRKQAFRKHVIALAPVVEEAARLLRATLPASVQLTLNCAAGLPNVLADPTQIHQVLVNLCTNAWHATEGRPGSIDVHLEEIAVDAPLARQHGSLRPGRHLRLSVKDTGKGMDGATKERIFEPFFTTKPVGVGTGLGLSVVLGIMQEHDGVITVDSTPGKGTTFQLYFPAVDAPSAAQSAETEVAALPQGEEQHVLYLDDDEALVSLVGRMLERRGYRVSGYTLPREALDAVRADPNSFDLVVSDYNMPGMSGLDVARELARIRPDLPVAMTSGFITDELRAKAPASGVRHLLYKPDTVDELCEIVGRLTASAG